MSSKPSTSRIAQKEVILTRHKSAQLKRQLRNKKSNITTISLLKSPSATKKTKPVQSGNASAPSPQKQKALSQQKRKAVPADNRRFTIKKNVLQVDDGKLTVTKGNKCYASPKRMKKISKDNLLYQEYYPNCIKRIFDVKKVILKPKHELIIIGETNKRKRCIPQKDLCYTLEDGDTCMMWNQESEYVKEDRTLRIDELIHMSENDLTDEDLLEILTCPSPVWWEDPNNEEYIEDAVLYSPSDNAMDIDETGPEAVLSIPNGVARNNQISTKNVDLLKSDKIFMKKRNKLENLLSCIKNKNVGSNNDEANGKRKRLEATDSQDDDNIDKDITEGDTEVEIINDEDSNSNVVDHIDVKINDTKIADKEFLNDQDSSDDVVESIKKELIDAKEGGEEIIDCENNCENLVETIEEEKMDTNTLDGKEIIDYEDGNENGEDTNVNKRPDSVISSKRSNSDSECDIFNDEKFEEMLINLENIDIPIKDENLSSKNIGATEIHLTSDENKFQDDDGDFKIVLIESDEELKFKNPDATVVKQEPNIIDDEIPKNLPPLTKCPSNLFVRKSSTDYQEDSSSLGSSQDIDYNISDANIRFLTDVEGTEKSLSSDEYRIAKKGIGGLKKLGQVVIPVPISKNNEIKHYNENGTIIIGNKEFINVYKIVDESATVETEVKCHKKNLVKVTEGVSSELAKIDTGKFNSNSLLKKNYSVH